MKCKTHVSVSAGFAFLMAALLFLDEGYLVYWALLCCSLHEYAHFLTIRLLGGQVETLRISIVGAELQPRRARAFSYGEELLITAAGPSASLLLAFCAAGLAPKLADGEAVFLFSGLNLALGLFNLLPLPPLDGGRLLCLLLLHRLEPRRAELLCARLALLPACALLTLGLLQLRYGRPTLLILGLWLFWGAARGAFSS